MATRLIEAFLPADRLELARSAVSSLDMLSIWSEKLSSGQAQLHILADSACSEEITDTLRTVLADSGDELRIVSLPVESSIPSPEMDGEEVQVSRSSGRKRPVSRVSREELYADVNEMVLTSGPNLAMTVLSAIVAAVGLARNSIAIIIGAMVIAPLLGPNVGLSLAATLGDLKLGLRAMRENLLRIGAAMLFAIVAGMLFRMDPDIPEVLSRTTVGTTDLVIALAAGAAGALALSTGASTSLIGVMVAAALMPPLVVAGLMAGQGDFPSALGALHLLAVNLISINLAGVLVFLLMGFRPGGVKRDSQTNASASVAAAVWIILLVLLTMLILTGNG